MINVIPINTVGKLSVLIPDSEKKDNAYRIHERQRHYDMLHHKRRIVWLNETPCLYDDGVVVPEYFRINLLNSSVAIVNKGISCNSVDLNDSAYLSVLDEFNSFSG